MNGSQIVVMTLRRQPVTANASPATFVLVCPRIGPNKPGTLAVVKPGLAVNIGGHLAADKTMQALWINVLVAGLERNAPAAQPRPAVRKK